jgi:hypothetical protein
MGGYPDVILHNYLQSVITCGHLVLEQHLIRFLELLFA